MSTSNEDNIQLKNNKFDINIKLLEEKQSDGLGASWLKLLFSGKDFNIKILNALRRASRNDVPSYAFAIESINIEANNSIAFNNDYMEGRLVHVPVFGVDTDVFYLHEKYWQNVNYSDIKREKHVDEKLIEAHINVHNNSASIKNVTSHDIKLYIENESVNPSPYQLIDPMLIIKLRPNETFKVYMKASLGVGDRHISWGLARNAFYDELINKNGDKEYEFQIEGNWQSNEYKILVKTCKYLIRKLMNTKKDLERKIQSNDITHNSIIHFDMKGEDHTIGEILNYEFQSHKDIIFSGVMKPNLLVKSMLIKVISVDNIKSPIKAMLECFDSLVNKLSQIGKTISDMEPDNYTSITKFVKESGKKSNKKKN